MRPTNNSPASRSVLIGVMVLGAVLLARSDPAATTGFTTPAAYANAALPIEADSDGVILVANVEVMAVPAVLPALSYVEIARSDPIELARIGLERYDRRIRDYSCTFYKQERIDGRLGKRERIAVRFRNEPRSVFMVWEQNVGQVKRALYVDSEEFVDRKGRQVAKIEPAGALIRLLLSEVEIPIHGKRAKESSRRAIDEFGFRSTLTLLENYNSIGEAAGVLEYSFTGEGTIDGRPTYVFVRHLPYEGESGRYPDAKLVMHLDQEWLLPTAVYSYADRGEKVLLGSYVFTNIQLNPGLTDADFEF